MRTKLGSTVLGILLFANSPARAFGTEPDRRVELQFGGGYDRSFFDREYGRLDFGLLRSSRCLPSDEAAIEYGVRFQPGRSRSGPSSYRTELSFGIRTLGRVQVSAGLQLAHVLLAKESTRSLVARAFLSSDEGLGIGGHLGFSTDLTRDDDVAVVLGVRGTAESIGYGVTGYLGVAFF